MNKNQIATPYKEGLKVKLASLTNKKKALLTALHAAGSGTILEKKLTLDFSDLLFVEGEIKRALMSPTK